MADHIEEDEQLEAFKRWWQENGLPIALALVLGLGGWFGWQHWQGARQEKSSAGSLVYLQMVEPLAGASVVELSEEQLAAMTEAANQLKTEHGGRQYGALAGLMLAKLAVARDDLDAANTELEWVMETSKDDALADIARLRLVRVLSSAERYDDALALAEGKAPDALVTGLAEARGDIYFLRGDTAAARAAYQSALDGLTAQDAMLKPLLEIKLNQVLPAEKTLSGDIEPGSTETSTTTEISTTETSDSDANADVEENQ
ncbi:MAG: tetratricopeptide repeat protein [Porticoccaceae bacterium]